MPDPMRAGAVILLLGAALALLPTAADAQDEAAPVDLGLYGTPLRFTAADGVTLQVTAPDGGSLLDSGVPLTGAVEVRLAPDGELTVVNDVTMSTYVEGIAEMPARWPLEALKAQAVAARTYAWFELEQGRWRRFGFDICASTACQVFHGREVVQAPEIGDRWARAVAETRGEVLVFDGDPILARYFSTSGGATRNNEHVFPGEGSRPYLKGVEDPDDAVSPLHRWTATFTREQMNEILSRGQQLSAAVPIADITHLTSPAGGSDRVRLTSQDGDVVEVGAPSFRAFVSSTAEELHPDTYPQDRPDGKPLPTTLPSSRFEVEITDELVTIHGRGWGHGVGMGQFGAMGKAERGLDYREILAAYYNGLEPVQAPDLPERIRVGLTTAATDVTISADGPFQVATGGDVITERGLGTWRVDAAPERTMQLSAPTGFGAPLVVAPTESSRLQPFEVEIVTLSTVVNKPTELSLEVLDRDTGTVTLDRRIGVVEAGRHEVRWDLDDAEGRQVAEGTYDVRLVAVDEDEAVGGTPVTIDVRAPAASGSTTSLLAALPAVPATDRSPWVPIAAVLGLAAGAAATTRWSRS
ncbi:MAG: SpoIID/LytB domain-containing protein [Nitriliruptorales bacterium]|nr:SpoIID/LytB domain-containing protein [Nitriliruptorales bacterium]